MMKSYLDLRQNAKFIMPWCVVFLLPSRFCTLWIVLKVEKVWLLRLSSGSSAGEPISGRTYKTQKLLYVAPYLTLLYPAFWKQWIYVCVFTFQNIIFLRSIERVFFEMEETFFCFLRNTTWIFCFPMKFSWQRINKAIVLYFVRTERVRLPEEVLHLTSLDLDVLLAVHLGIILSIDQLNAEILVL